MPDAREIAAVATWASVPVGSVIVLYNSNDNCYGFTVDESGTGPYFIEVGSSAMIERTTTRPTPTDCDYCDAAYAAPGSSPWNTVAMGNTADAIQVRCPDCPEDEAGFFHGLGYGSGFNGITAGAFVNKVPIPELGRSVGQYGITNGSQIVGDMSEGIMGSAYNGITQGALKAELDRYVAPLMPNSDTTPTRPMPDSGGNPAHNAFESDGVNLNRERRVAPAAEF